jgi:uncharacterized protein involved in outer membrane biogenesis
MGSSWHQSKLLRIAAASVGLVVVSLLLLPYFFSLDRYRPMIVAGLKQATGREVELESIRLHFLPTVGVGVGNLRLRNPRGFPEGDTVSVGRVDIGLALVPLLRRQVEVTAVTVSGVRVNLLGNELGQTNYASLLKPKPSAGGAKTQAPVSLGAVGRIAVRDVTLSSGTFWSRDRRIYPGWSLHGMNLQAAGFDFSQANWLEKGTAHVDLSQIEVSSPSLRQPLRFVKGELTLRGKSAEGNYVLSLGRLRAAGTLEIANLERPVGDFTLTMKELNTAELAPLLGRAEQGPSGTAASGELLARGAIQIDRVVVPPLTAENLEGKVRLYGNRLQVDPFALHLYGGRTQGSLGLDLSSASQPARLSVRVSGVDVGKVMAAASPESRKAVTGTFEANAQLGIPLGARDPLAAASGEGAFAVRNGTFPGLDLQSSLAQMAKFLDLGVPTGDTRFNFFGGDFRLSQSRVHSNQLRLDAEQLEAAAGGSIGLDQTLNYTGTGLLKGSGSAAPVPESSSPLGALKGVFGRAVKESLPISRMRIPFLVRGTLEDPKILPAGPPTPVP